MLNSDTNLFALKSAPFDGLVTVHQKDEQQSPRYIILEAKHPYDVTANLNELILIKLWCDLSQ